VSQHFSFTSMPIFVSVIGEKNHPEKAHNEPLMDFKIQESQK